VSPSGSDRTRILAFGGEESAARHFSSRRIGVGRRQGRIIPGLVAAEITARTAWTEQAVRQRHRRSWKNPFISALTLGFQRTEDKLSKLDASSLLQRLAGSPSKQN